MRANEVNQAGRNAPIVEPAHCICVGSRSIFDSRESKPELFDRGAPAAA
jgi:hypothetical protein